MKRLFAGIAAVLVTGMALAGCGEKKTADILTSEAYEDEEDIVISSEETAEYAAKGVELNGFEKYEDAVGCFVNAVKERDISQLKDVFFIRDEVQYIMPVDQGIFGLVYKQAVSLMDTADYETDYSKETGGYTDEELQYADEMANMYYVYGGINKEVTGGNKELSDDERAAVTQKIQAFDFDFENVEKPVSVTEGKHCEVGLKKDGEIITMLFSLYKVNDEKWLIQDVECNRKAE